MDTLVTVLIFFVLLAVIAVPYWRKVAKSHRQALEMRERSAKAGLLEPVTLHPRIELTSCIGCASCVRVCPEEVLGIVDGRAAIINGVRCIGHGLCAEVCPVGAITLGFGKPREGMEIPLYDEHYMTNIEGLYIVGELGGVGLIKNAIGQGIKAVAHIAQRQSALRAAKSAGQEKMYDVLIIGAGPAGLGAGLAAQANGLNHIILEQEDLGGSILHYPRQKLVITSPVELPLYGKLKVSEISKEELLGVFTAIVHDHGLNLQTHRKVESVKPLDGIFSVTTGGGTLSASHVILALGRRGSPRKLGVPGEDLPKVYYRLIETSSYHDRKILVVGGGDSAIEAAVGLADQKGNTVTLSYRKDSFVRLKEKNEKRIKEMTDRGAVRVIFSSDVTEIRPDSVIIRQGTSGVHDVPNDFVFIFAGGELPGEFLKKTGVSLRTSDEEPGKS